MKVVEQSFEVIKSDNPLSQIEYIGRTCYKSEDQITEDSSGRFCKMLHDRGHHAMLEHYRFILEVPKVVYDTLYNCGVQFVKFTYYHRYIISFSARGLIDMVTNVNPCCQGYMTNVVGEIRNELVYYIINKYKCPQLFGLDECYNYAHTFGVTFLPIDELNDFEKYYHGWMSAKIVTDRGISHEIVRHRKETSFAQESTRYCNYAKDRFDNEITVIDQGFDGDNKQHWEQSLIMAEESYFALINEGVSPQFARSLLPTCTKTEIVTTATYEEWLTIFELRVMGTAGKPHPLMQSVMSGIFDMVMPEWNITMLGTKLVIGEMCLTGQEVLPDEEPDNSSDN